MTRPTYELVVVLYGDTPSLYKNCAGKSDLKTTISELRSDRSYTVKKKWKTGCFYFYVRSKNNL